MRSRSMAGSAGSQAASHIGSKVPTRSSAAHSRVSGAGASIKEGSVRQRTAPPKNDYEKYYENVFLGDDSDPESQGTSNSQQSEPSRKRSLHAMLREEPQRPKVGRPRKIPILLEPYPEQPKDAVIRQINGDPLPVKRQFVHQATTYARCRTDKLGQQLYTKTERHVWKKEAIQMFLQLWAHYIKDLRGPTKNCVVYREMEKQMSEFGPSHFEIKTKMDNMSRKYRLEAEKVRETGQPSTWEYFHRIQSLLIGTKSVDVFEEIMFENKVPTNLSPELESDDDLDSIKEEVDVDHSVNEAHNFKDAHESSLERSIKNSPVASPEFEEPADEDEEEEEEPEQDEEHEQEQDMTVDLEDQYEEDLPEDQSEKHVSRSQAMKYRSDRLLQIEEEKLSIEREKLQVMKDALKELTSFHKDLIVLFRQKRT
ncbi:trichoplein keratin filament-binding protein [Drosophila bipectinata]|uniref:trichoplein keratin filament-binding protein n=1 Tax=Drosophila bipectinata TaxID=42026 RepID=UPI001C89C95D|nr:neurofilament medium polypeptide [Drosophila bipectinata]